MEHLGRGPIRQIFLLWGLTCLFAPGLAFGQADGYIALFSDPSGAQPCTWIPSGSTQALYIFAITEGESQNGVSGAEFGVQLTHANGWAVSYTSPANSELVPGNIMALDSTIESDITLRFSDCRMPLAGRVFLGTITLQNLSGQTTDLIIRGKNTLSNNTRSCAMLRLCAPAYKQTCSLIPTTINVCSLSTNLTQPTHKAYVHTVIPQSESRVLPDTSPFAADVDRNDCLLWLEGREIVAERFEYKFDGVTTLIAGEVFETLREGRTTPSKDQLMRTYGGAPFIRRQMEAGISIHRAVELFGAQTAAVRRLVRWAYETDQFHLADRMAMEFQVIQNATLSQEKSSLRYKYKGMGISMGISPGVPGVRKPTRREAAQSFLKSLTWTLNTNQLVLASHGGISSYSAAAIPTVVAQLRHVETGSSLETLPAGPLRKNDLMLRLIRQRLNRKK